MYDCIGDAELQNMTYTLSFCIPTLNFGSFIGETLQSILGQTDERVQVVIVDGGSTDNTAAIVAEAITRCPRIKLIQREKRCGVDLDILESVAQADAEYCWLFSSDDVLVAGAIAQAMKSIEQGGWDVFLMGIKLCDLQMKPLHDHPILTCTYPRIFDWSDPCQRADYFRHAHTSTAFFSFISNIIVRRDRWLATPTEEHFIGSCWIIAAKLAAMSLQGIRVRFDPGIYLFKRGENDSFAANGLIPRIKLSIVGFRDLWSYFYGDDSFEARQVSRVVANEYPLVEMLSMKLRLIPNATCEERGRFYSLARLHFRDRASSGQVCYGILRLSPVWFLRITQYAFHFLRSVRQLVKVIL